MQSYQNAVAVHSSHRLKSTLNTNWNNSLCARSVCTYNLLVKIVLWEFWNSSRWNSYSVINGNKWKWSATAQKAARIVGLDPLRGRNMKRFKLIKEYRDIYWLEKLHKICSIVCEEYVFLIRPIERRFLLKRRAEKLFRICSFSKLILLIII